MTNFKDDKLDDMMDAIRYFSQKVLLSGNNKELFNHSVRRLYFLIDAYRAYRKTRQNVQRPN